MLSIVIFDLSMQKILKNVIDWYLQEEDSERDR